MHLCLFSMRILFIGFYSVPMFPLYTLGPCMGLHNGMFLLHFCAHFTRDRSTLSSPHHLRFHVPSHPHPWFQVVVWSRVLWLVTDYNVGHTKKYITRMARADELEIWDELFGSSYNLAVFHIIGMLCQRFWDPWEGGSMELSWRRCIFQRELNSYYCTDVWAREQR